MGGGPHRDEMMVGYIDKMCVNMKKIRGTMENMVKPFNITQPRTLGNL